MRKRIWYSPPWFLFWRLNTAIFCLIRGKKQQIPRRKKAYRRLFRAGAESMTQPLLYDHAFFFFIWDTAIAVTVNRSAMR